LAERVDVTEFIDGRNVGGFQYTVALLCAVTVFFDGYDTQSIAFVAPSIARELHLSNATLGPLFSVGLVGLLIGQLALSPLADRIGRRVLIIACTIIFGIFTLLAAGAHSVAELMVLRLLAGVGLGGVMPNAIALTAEYASRRRRATMVMIMFTGFSLGATVGGALAASLIDSFGWRSVWYIGGSLPLVLSVLQLAYLPESIRFLVLAKTAREKVTRLLQRIDYRFTATADVEYVLDEAPSAGVPLAQIFQNNRLFGTVMLWIMFFSNLFANFLLQNWIPTLAHDAGMSIRTSVIIGTMFQLSGTLASLLLGWPMDRFGSYRVITVLFAFAIPLTAAIGTAMTSAPLLFALTFGAGFCIVGVQNAINALAAIFCPTAMRATGSGWALGIGRIGGILGPLAASALLQAHMANGTLFLLAAIAPLCATVAVVAMARVYGPTQAEKPP
jgi:AAHS family 4-hydroxybenzoate transporter-like MFS transporter